jgi:hypothetical protein
MGAPYHVLVLIPQGIEQKKAVHETDDLLRTWGGYFCKETKVLFSDIGEEEFEEEELGEVNEENIERFLDKLAKWPTFGLIEYEMPWFVLNVSYDGQAHSSKVNLILLSLLRNTFLDYQAAAEPFYIELSKVLHAHFHAKRTIMDYDIMHREGFDWEEEIERLKNNQFAGEYKILDLRRE